MKLGGNIGRWTLEYSIRSITTGSTRDETLSLELEEGHAVKDRGGLVVIHEPQVICEVPRPLNSHAAYFPQIQCCEYSANLGLIWL